MTFLGAVLKAQKFMSRDISVECVKIHLGVKAVSCDTWCYVRCFSAFQVTLSIAILSWYDDKLLLVPIPETTLF